VFVKKGDRMGQLYPKFNLMFKTIITTLLISGTCLTTIAQRSNKLSDSLPKVHSYLAPAVFIGYGLISLGGNNAIRRLDYSTHAELKEDFPTFTHRADNYLRYAPVIAVYGLDLVGVKAENTIADRSMMLLSSYVIASLSVSSVKGFSNRMRPSGNNDQSFPSGHTAIAFMAAEFVHQEYKDQSIWYSVGGYAIATGTGVLRMYNNAHWLSDVVAGAGFGILSSKLTYLVYPYMQRTLFKGRPRDLLISPSYQHKTFGIRMVKRL
jgi:hypothetical protein